MNFGVGPLWVYADYVWQVLAFVAAFGGGYIVGGIVQR